MNYIILDLEWNQAAYKVDEEAELPFEIIEIGAVKLNKNAEIIDEFTALIRPQVYPFLVRRTREITGLSDDDLDMLTGKARALLDAGADLLIFSGGMSVDPDDLTPTAIRALGAEIVTHGVPSQPGNMTLVAYLGDVPILGVPGAAISMPTTIFDVLLPQVFAGVHFTKAELTGLAEGGLCQLCKACHFPNCTFGRY